ncbi:hypothetical protein EDD18DRAFT_1306655 [Armillaria luteobubalina]|uniref:Protein kinase domain-containing protein n=1 Tax=Armillaria luteobubalina TaxID=153913 RepID=A0AA39V1Q1_9AGAR|nr:hypothetical protein EDD18DRAFT_1306655 [Armillaria luteobubalina]
MEEPTGISYTQSMPWPHPSWRNAEIFWIWHYQFLQDNGYQLCPKFHPNWKPKWKTDDDNPPIMDAAHIKDKKLVTLKKVSRTNFSYKVDLALFLTSPQLSDNPKNHCVPIYEVLQSPCEPDVQIMAMPHLHEIYSPDFDTVGKFLDEFHQIFDGMEFMHQNFVAHRLVSLSFQDITILNMMLDPSRLYPKVHFFVSHITCTQCWPQYYLIDFGSSHQYDPEKLPFNVSVIAGDRSAAEFVEHDHPPLHFLLPLVDDMTQDDPSLWPTISEVVTCFTKLCNSLMKSQKRLQT